MAAGERTIPPHFPGGKEESYEMRIEESVEIN
jgi:hypothetical protein